jgi:enoyl-CoA hydratase/carnithine racemase
VRAADDRIFFSIEESGSSYLLRLRSIDATNRLTDYCIPQLTGSISDLAKSPRPLVIAGNQKFFSVGADLEEIALLDATTAYEFSRRGQLLMQAVENFPSPVCAAISGYCMGGGFDLALACHRRIAAPNAVFGHRGAALGLITGWGGTQRLPRLIGKSLALEIFVTAEKIDAPRALALGLVHAIADDPVAEALRTLQSR